MAIGIPMLAVSARAAMKAYNRDGLETTGIFGIVRNPIYSAWIVFIIPGMVVLSRSWPMLLTPLVAYFVFKFSIWQEEQFLEKTFGDVYRDYRTRVNELFPRW